LWNDLVRLHLRIRRLNWTWPTKSRWERWGKQRYPNLHSQSVQQIIGEFLESVNSTRQLRKNDHDEANYPWKVFHYRDVVYTNQAARIVEDKIGRLLILPNGQSGRLVVRIPAEVQFPGRVMEVRLLYGRLLVVCEIPDLAQPKQVVIAGDLGVNSLITVTDGEKAVVISGREAKATVQWRNKKLSTLQEKQSHHQRGSRRHKRLQRRKYKLLDKSRNRIKNIVHHATDMVRDEFPGALVYVGKPFNEAAQKIGRVWAQQVSSACNRKIIEQLDYKTTGAVEVSEAYTSQTCPVCGARQVCRRTYHCRKCSYTAPRDVVGAVNILRIGQQGMLKPSPMVPKRIQFRHPIKYPATAVAGSSGGHPASSLKT
jgi:putative transposase